MAPETPVNLAPSAFVADSTLLDALEQRSQKVPCDEERPLFKQGDPPVGVYVVRKGKVALTMQSPGGEVVMQIQATPGSLLGLPGLIGNEPYSLSAVAMSGAEVGFVVRDDFSALIQADPQLSFKVLQVLAAEVRTARQAIFDL
jgi:CRP-like cAMP-binding protein